MVARVDRFIEELVPYGSGDPWAVISDPDLDVAVDERRRDGDRGTRKFVGVVQDIG